MVQGEDQRLSLSCSIVTHHPVETLVFIFEVVSTLSALVVIDRNAFYGRGAYGRHIIVSISGFGVFMANASLSSLVGTFLPVAFSLFMTLIFYKISLFDFLLVVKDEENQPGNAGQTNKDASCRDVKQSQKSRRPVGEGIDEPHFGVGFVVVRYISNLFDFYFCAAPKVYRRFLFGGEHCNDVKEGAAAPTA